MNTVTKAPEYLVWSYTTLLLCAGGWLTYWLMAWRREWKLRQATFADFLDDNPPALWISIVATLAMYVIGPSILPIVGLDLATLPGSTAALIANVGSYAIGLGSNFLVYKIARMLRAGSGGDDDGPQA